MRSLAKMLAMRDLPKIVRDPKRDPLKVFRDRDAHATIDRIVGSFVKGEPSYFWFDDEVPFQLLDPNSESGCWITNGRNSLKTASHLKSLPSLQSGTMRDVETRFYLPEGAVDDVRKTLDL